MPQKYTDNNDQRRQHYRTGPPRRMNEGDDPADLTRFEKIPSCMTEKDLMLFRTVVCTKKQAAGITGKDCEKEGACPFSHCLSWQRRNPYLFDYFPQMCPNLNLSREDRKGDCRGTLRVKNSCNSGQRCKFSHTKEEQLYHPNVYKTKLCNAWHDNPDVSRCKKFFCPFAHGEEELRRTSDPRRERNPAPSRIIKDESSNMGDHVVTSSRNFNSDVTSPALRDSVFKPTKMNGHDADKTLSGNYEMDVLSSLFPPVPFPMSLNGSLNSGVTDPNTVEDLTQVIHNLNSRDNIGKNNTSNGNDNNNELPGLQPRGVQYFTYRGNSYPCTQRDDKWYECIMTLRVAIPPDSAQSITTLPLGHVICDQPENPFASKAQYVDPISFFMSSPFYSPPPAMKMESTMGADYARFPSATLPPMEGGIMSSRIPNLFSQGKSRDPFFGMNLASRRWDVNSNGGMSVDDTSVMKSTHWNYAMNDSRNTRMSSQENEHMILDPHMAVNPPSFARGTSRLDSRIGSHGAGWENGDDIGSIRHDVDAYGVDSQGNSAI